MPGTRDKRETNNSQGVLPPHYMHELPAQAEERLEKLFQSLDLDGNGKIDVHDLSKALHEAGVHKHYAEVFFCAILLTLVFCICII